MTFKQASMAINVPVGNYVSIRADCWKLHGFESKLLLDVVL